VPVNERGPTAIGNLALLCSRHHHRLHQPGWRATLDRDATLHITDDRNQHRSSRPPGALAVTLALAT
jgi:hypothetical protein